MDAEPDPSVAPWRELTRQLQASARAHGLSHEDAEDRAQEAALKTWLERPRPGAPPLEVRAARARQLAEIDAYRKQTRKKDIPPKRRLSLDDPAAEEVPDQIDLEAGLRFAEMTNAVLETAGRDAVKLLFENVAGYTELESDARREAHAPTAGALRKRISRAIPDIHQIINSEEGDQ